MRDEIGYDEVYMECPEGDRYGLWVTWEEASSAFCPYCGAPLVAVN